MFKSSYTQNKNVSVLLHESIIVFLASFLEVRIFEVGSSVFLFKAADYEELKM